MNIGGWGGGRGEQEGTMQGFRGLYQDWASLRGGPTAE